MMKKFVADTYYEAFLKAQNEMGDNMIVVTSRVFQKKTWGGFFIQEMVEITAAVPREANPKFERAGIPTRPVPAEEIFNHPQFPPRTLPTTITRPPPPPPIANEPSFPSAALPESFKPIESKKESPKPFRQVKSTYDANLRKGHTLRTNQEGDLDPHPQKCTDDEEKTQKMQDLLGEILKKRQDALPGKESSPQKAPLAKLASQGRSNSDSQGDGPSIRELEKRISEIHQMIMQLQSGAQTALAKSIPDCPDGIQKLKERLIKLEMPSEALDELVRGLQSEISLNAQKTFSLLKPEFKNWLRKKLKFSSEPTFKKGSGPSIMVLLGPTGVGKTTTIAKLAAFFSLESQIKRSVSLFTLDTFRIGATSQLGQYAQIIEAGMEIIFDPSEVNGALEKHAERDLILIDTAGRCQKSTSEIHELMNFLKYFPESARYLVLSATTKFTDMIETISQFGECDFQNLIFTKVDETNSIGPLLGLMLRTSHPLAYTTHGQVVPCDFRPANLEFFLSRVFPED